jgi:hypothetical protein
MKTLKVMIAHLLLRPVINVLFFLLVKIHGFTCITIGQVTFCGDERFLELATKAIEHLRMLDKDLYRLITSGCKMRFYSSQKRSEQAIGLGLFNVNDGFCEMGVQGVLARIVYAHFVFTAFGSEHFSKTEPHRALKLGGEAESQTRVWLEEKGFSTAIIKVFSRNKSRCV